MTGVLPFIDINGREVANAYRTASYLQRGLGPLTLNAASLGCSILGREVGGVAPFVSPSADPAPWYDAAVPESAEFLGFVPRMNFQDSIVKRSVSQRFGGIGGGVIGFEQLAAKELKVDGYLIASSCAGLEYGRHWLYSQLGADCNGCGLYVVRVRESCPPISGANDTRGEKIMYNAALTDGITETDDGGQDCCEYDGIGFTISAESPYLYSRPGATTSPVTIGNSGGLAPVPPAILDTFVRANTGPPPSASWTGSILSTDGNTLRVLSNALDNSVHTAGTIGSAYWNSAAFAADMACSVVCTTRVNNGRFGLRARIQNPGLANANYVEAEVLFGASSATDILRLRRIDAVTGVPWSVSSAVTPFASGDTFMLTCRGALIEAWRKPSGGAWSRLASAYDPVPGATGKIGIAILEVGAVTQTLGAFGGGTLTNGAAYPVDPVIVAMPAVSIGIESPIITLTEVASVPTVTSANAVRFQLKQYPSCTETDDFSSNDLATRWWSTVGVTGWTITGGKLKPTTITTARALQRSRDGTQANLVQYLGGRVEATVKLGATVTNGVWGVSWANVMGAFLVKSSNTFALSVVANTGALDSVSFTPVAGTTYRVICEYLPLNDGSGGIDVRAYLVDQSAPGVMLTRPLRTTLAAGPVNGLVTPAIETLPADTAEEWDAFYAVDTADSPQYMEASIPAGVLIIDGSRRVTQFTPAGSTTSQEASSRISTPIGTPLGWPDVCAGSGQGCLEILASEVAWPGTTYTVALQQRVR